MPHVSDKRLWLTADRERVVEEGDPDAAFLFATEGDEVSDDDAKRYGLGAAEGAPRGGRRAAAPADEEKAAAPAEDKSVGQGENKGA